MLMENLLRLMFLVISERYLTSHFKLLYLLVLCFFVYRVYLNFIPVG
jgi:hypothetical protein